MYNVWNTIYPEDVKEVIAHANKNRFAVDAVKVKENTILITEEW